MPNKRSSADLGVVIVSYNVAELLAGCLTALEGELSAADLTAEIVVVDNASTDGTVDLVESRFPDVHLEVLRDNLGFAAANNIALDSWLAHPATAPQTILLLNPDTIVRPGSLTALLRTLEERPGAGIVGPMLVYPDGRLQHSAFRFPGAIQSALDLFPIPRLMDSPLNGRYPVSRYESGEPFEVDLVLGACMLAGFEAVAAAGTLDAGFRMYCEELDWCKRFANAGYSVICSPAAEVVHYGGASTGQRPTAMFVELWRSRLRYYSKHESPWRRAFIVSVIRIGLAGRRMADRLAVARGKMSEVEYDARKSAYRLIRSREAVEW
jgi:GT2 family glycosyltransferase